MIKLEKINYNNLNVKAIKDPKDKESVYLSEIDRTTLSFEEIKSRIIEELLSRST